MQSYIERELATTIYCECLHMKVDRERVFPNLAKILLALQTKSFVQRPLINPDAALKYNLIKTYVQFGSP